MIEWKNTSALESFAALKTIPRVNLKAVMSGANGAERVAKYAVPMSSGLTYHYAAKEVDDTVLAGLCALAKEAQLAEKFQELYEGAVINTGE